MAAVMMTVDARVLKGTQWILRGGLGEITVPLQRIQEDKSLKVTLDLSDLSQAKFPTTVDPTKGEQITPTGLMVPHWPQA